MTKQGFNVAAVFFCILHGQKQADNIASVASKSQSPSASW